MLHSKIAMYRKRQETQKNFWKDKLRKRRKDVKWQIIKENGSKKKHNWRKRSRRKIIWENGYRMFDNLKKGSTVEGLNKLHK